VNSELPSTNVLTQMIVSLPSLVTVRRWTEYGLRRGGRCLAADGATSDADAYVVRRPAVRRLCIHSPVAVRQVFARMCSPLGTY